MAKEAALTPIVPSPKDPTRPAFQLYAELDLPVLGIGIVFVSGRLTRTQGAYCAPKCDPHDLNALDRTTAGFWRPTWSTASDFGLYGIAALAAATLVIDEGAIPALNDAVVVAESGLTATAVASVLTLAAGRPRPYLYGENAPLDQRESGNATLSYVSSHTAVSFAIVTSTFMATKRLNPRSAVPFVVLAVGTAAASFVGLARVMAGQHFITDTIGGAVVGASVGLLVSGLHGSPVRVVPVVSDTHRGLGVIGKF